MMNLLAERLRLLRLEKKMTQSAMAKEILVPRVTYTHYELGKRTPDLDTIIKLANYHCVSVDFLVGNSGFRSTLYPFSEMTGERVADAPINAKPD